MRSDEAIGNVLEAAIQAAPSGSILADTHVWTNLRGYADEAVKVIRVETTNFFRELSTDGNIKESNAEVEIQILCGIQQGVSETEIAAIIEANSLARDLGDEVFKVLLANPNLTHPDNPHFCDCNVVGNIVEQGVLNLGAKPYGGQVFIAVVNQL